MLSVKIEDQPRSPRVPIEVMLVKQENLNDLEISSEVEREPFCDLMKEEKDDQDEMPSVASKVKPEKVEKGSREYLLEPEIIIKMIYKCRGCGEDFEEKSSFEEHVGKVHGVYKNSNIPQQKTNISGNAKEMNQPRISRNSCSPKSYNLESQIDLKIYAEDIHMTNPRKTINSSIKSSEVDIQKTQTTKVKSHEKSHKTAKGYFCESCKKTFSSSSTLRQHHKGVHLNIKQKKPEIYRCKFCKEELPNEYQKAKHQAQVHFDGEKPKRSCWICGTEIQLFIDFKKHVESHETENLKICLSCGFQSSDQETMNEHLENHKNLRRIEQELRRLTCDMCGHKVYTRGQLKVHMRNHMKEADFYVCDICGQSYKFFSSFQYHKKMHEGRKDYVCTECGKKFMQKQVFNIHMRTHTQEKPFKCTVCEKSFTSKPVLKTHLQIHASTRRVISCEECNLTFIYQKHLKAHEERFHPNRRPFQCHLCSKKFMHEYLRKIHMKQKHKPDSLNFCELPMSPE